MSCFDVILRKARAARRLAASDWGTLLHAWFLLLAVDMGLRLLPFRWVQRYAARVRPAGRPADEGAVVERVRRLVDTAARNHLYPMRCLRQALVLQRLLGRRGIAAALRIGVRKDEAELKAHAWLEWAGRPIGEAGDVATHYAPLRTQEADG